MPLSRLAIGFLALAAPAWPFAEYLGLIREGGSTLGMLSLEPNTDGSGGGSGHFFTAGYNGIEGSRLQAESLDRTQDRPGGHFAQAVPAHHP
ncbi:hypothetical protein KBB96_07115 [Luteolibacter ambystomatis]|uniref:Uncharacterized protein n=1 Tax=Luteolibacter ambystomatis TaxID=2824561 RepID=A0A975PGE0_9BACT|nr:hypothetical protein [Luteolibacter ambystomatis]QUE52658.1 hypothetical protein KBB96_07115 [Luteolibacter ambystomatis]